jgi:hypothetical protein
MKQLLADFRTNLRNGLALALMRRVTVDDFRSNIDQLIALILLSLLLEVGAGFVTTTPAPEFNRYAFSTFSLGLVLFALASYLLSVFLSRRDAVLPLLIMLYSPAPVIYLGLVGLELLQPVWSPSQALPLALLYLLWVIAITLRAVLLAFAQPRRTIPLSVVIYSLICFVPLFSGDWEREFWYAQQEQDDNDAYRKMDAESLLYAQPRMVSEALQGLVPQRPGMADLYFVSFGAYAHQDVFMKEVRYARQTMDERFDTRGHSLELVNNLQSRELLPLATASNLQAVLQHLGEAMDSEEDVLMLYLTSHGSEQHELAVEFWPLPLNDITPQRLRSMLDEAGIKWRVIVVSACYSGGFVAALKDEHTLVATASAADRQSFGCGNDNDFTYFGEALFHDALQRGATLPQAFEQARQAIGARERREKLQPSQPQLYVAPLLEEKLGELSGARPPLECGAAVGC